MPEIHMHSLRIDVRRLMSLGQGIGQRVQDLDLGYLVHAATAKMFGDMAPRPFSLSDIHKGGEVRLLGYSSANGAELHAQAQACADPEAFSCVRWSSASSKPMPAFRKGSAFSFEVRTCPVVRRRREGRDRSDEVDAFLAALSRAEREGSSAPERHDVYLDWFRARTSSRGIQLGKLSLKASSRGTVFRRTQGNERKSRPVVLPNVIFEGTLEVGDVELFDDAIGRGIGRHKAFGFGMLLLKPAR